jgi:co-chaperonin GroES (HSP10)
MSFQVLAHRVAVKPFTFDEWDEDRKKAKELGFVLPDMEENKRAKASVDVGTVIQIGSTAEVEAKVGDTVAYVKNAGKFVVNPYTKEELYLLNDEDILVVLKKEAE